jgi:hypothetical protein
MKLSREWDLNPRPAVYETAALPLSYLGFMPASYDVWRWHKLVTSANLKQMATSKNREMG